MSGTGLAATYRRFGLLALLHDLFISVANRLAYFRIQVVYLITDTNVAANDAVDIRIMDDETLQHCSADVRLDMPAHFIATATANGDRCFGAFSGNELIGYAWFAINPVAYSNGLTAHFGSDYVHAYKNWTSPSARGSGLQKAIKAKALQHYRQSGKQGIVVAIDSHNFSSRRSTEGSGGKRKGLWLILRRGRHHIGKGSPGCATVGYRLERQPGDELPQPPATTPAAHLQLTVSRLASIDAIESLGAPLVEFLRQCRLGTGFFYQPGLMRVLAPLYLHDGSEELFFLIARSGDSIIALAPLQRETKGWLKGRIRRLHFWGGIPGSLNNMSSDILVAEPAHAAAAVAAFRQYLTTSARSDWDLLDLAYVSDDAWCLPYLPGQFTIRSANRESMETYILDLPGSYADYCEKFPKKLLGDLKRRERRLREESSDFSLQVVEKLAPYQRARIADLHRQRQGILRDKGSRRHSIFEIDREATTFWGMIDFAESSEQGRFYLLEADHRIIAFFIAFPFGETLHHYLMAMDDAYTKYAPSKILMLFLAQQEIERRDIRHVNLSTGVNTFKQEFCNRSTRHWRLEIDNPHPASKLRLSAFRLMHQLKAAPGAIIRLIRRS